MQYLDVLGVPQLPVLQKYPKLFPFFIVIFSPQ